MSDRVTGRNNPTLAELLADGVSYRKIDNWVRRGFLRPEMAPTKNGGRNTWTWSLAEQRVVLAMARLDAAGLRPEAAEKVARHPTGGPVVLGPGVIISLFALPASKDVATEAEAS